MQQLIAVITSLLLKLAPKILQTTIAILNFIMLATYSFHNKNTLEYPNLARSRINMLKTMFTIYNAIEIEIEQKTFNKFKFHVLSYYKDFIRKFESTDN